MFQFIFSVIFILIQTSIMAKAAFEARGLVSSKAIVITRFCGVTPDSSTTFKLVESICIQLQAVSETNLKVLCCLFCLLNYEDISTRQVRYSIRVPTNHQSISELASTGNLGTTYIIYSYVLQKIIDVWEIVLFVDSLNQLNDEFAADLRWIPNDLPDNVFLIVSSLGIKNFN